MSRKDPLDTSTLDAPRRASKGALVPTARVVYRADAGVVSEDARPLAEGDTWIGRAAQAGISLAEDTLASREHARVQRKASQVSIEDNRSRNGVFVRGVRVARAELADGDVIRIGGSLIVLRYAPRQQLDAPNALLAGSSPAMKLLRTSIARIAPSDVSVLATGESGSGKELVARSVHEASGRRGPFVAVNCAAIPETLAESELFGHVAGSFTGARGDHPGVFRAASGGTLFLDEIGDMPLSLQPKLLRALETHEVVPVGASSPHRVNVRVVAATNVGLAGAIASGRFRGDLFARLAQVRIALPPLRERREDILTLFISKLGQQGAARDGLSPDLAEALLSYDWPFNVRELFAVATEAALHATPNEPLDLDIVGDRLARAAEDEPAPRAEEAAPHVTREGLERELERCDGNVAALARAIGRSRTQTYRLLAQFGLALTRSRTD